MNTNPRADVVVVGLGAAGGTAVLPLAEAGLNVVGIEAGPRAPERNSGFDELRHQGYRHALGRWKSSDEVPTFRPNCASAARLPETYVTMDNAVGGSTNSWGCQWYRNLPWNFRQLSATVRCYGPGAVPEGTTVADWPISYEDLEAYYDAVEHLHGVSGKAGNLRGTLDPRGNIFEGPREREFPLSPLRRTGWTELMSDAAASMGWHPFPGAAAIRSRPFRGLAHCRYCGFCRGQACYASAKVETSLAGIPDAERARHFRILSRARVTSVLTDENGGAAGVVYVKDGQARIQPADLVILAGYTYENVRLLLLSRSPAFPSGLANNSDQVGRHFATHVFLGAFAVFPGRRLNRYTGTQAQFVATDAWNGDNFDHAGLGFIGGGTLTAGMEVKPIEMALTTPPTAPRWGTAYKAWLRTYAGSVGSAFAQLEVLPYAGNRLDLDPTVRDTAGIPVVRCTADLHDNERKQGAFLQERMIEWLGCAGASETWTTPLEMQAVGTHACGGTRMGDDPETSVVDAWGFCHEVPNLAVVGASCFVTAGGQNPTATVMALSWRTAQRIVERWPEFAGRSRRGERHE